MRAIIGAIYPVYSKLLYALGAAARGMLLPRTILELLFYTSYSPITSTPWYIRGYWWLITLHGSAGRTPINNTETLTLAEFLIMRSVLTSV